MENWYTRYWSQKWYKNTYLVKNPKQIGRAKGNNREWNNIHDSGCNVTCLAMAIGIDPAYFASELASYRNFFTCDRTIPAVTLAKKTLGLVWDQNRPRIGEQLQLNSIWIHNRSRKSVAVQLVKVISTAERAIACQIVKEAHEAGQHIICGPDDHSALVAGRTDTGEYYLWDPDPEGIDIGGVLEGKITLGSVVKGQIEFWLYKISLF